MNAPVRQHEMKIMDPTGHLTVKWDRNKRDEVDNARSQFEAFRGKGYSCFHMDGDSKGARMDSFDPNAESLMMVAPLAGG